jgi:hypothetical protein
VIVPKYAATAIAIYVIAVTVVAAFLGVRLHQVETPQQPYGCSVAAAEPGSSFWAQVCQTSTDGA